MLYLQMPGKPYDGGWTLGVYLDQRASTEQAEALGTILSGQAGGMFAALGGLIGTALPPKQVAISFDTVGGENRISVPGLLEVGSEQIPHPIAVCIRLRRIGRVRAVVGDVQCAIAVGVIITCVANEIAVAVRLIRVRHQQTIITGVQNAVSICVIVTGITNVVAIEIILRRVVRIEAVVSGVRCAIAIDVVIAYIAKSILILV